MDFNTKIENSQSCFKTYRKIFKLFESWIQEAKSQQTKLKMVLRFFFLGAEGLIACRKGFTLPNPFLVPHGLKRNYFGEASQLVFEHIPKFSLSKCQSIPELQYQAINNQVSLTIINNFQHQLSIPKSSCTRMRMSNYQHQSVHANLITPKYSCEIVKTRVKISVVKVQLPI